MEAFALTCVKKMMSNVAKVTSNIAVIAIKSCSALINHPPVPAEPPEVLLHREEQAILLLDPQSEDLFTKWELASGRHGGKLQHLKSFYAVQTSFCS